MAGFDNQPNTFFECATARIKLGPILSPRITTMVLRDGDTEIAINTIWKALTAKACYDYFSWHFESSNSRYKIKGVMKASKNSFVGLNYYNPPSGSNTCLNSKIASCHLQVTDASGNEKNYSTKHRAAFEILTSDNKHGVPIVA